MINLDLLSRLMDHDPERVNMFIDIFKSDVPAQLEDLHLALTKGQYQDASIYAHTIKSQCKYLGLDEIADLAYTIEKDVTISDDQEAIKDLYRKLYEQLYQVLMDLP